MARSSAQALHAYSAAAAAVPAGAPGPAPAEPAEELLVDGFDAEQVLCLRGPLRVAVSSCRANAMVACSTYTLSRFFSAVYSVAVQRIRLCRRQDASYALRSSASALHSRKLPLRRWLRWVPRGSDSQPCAPAAGVAAARGSGARAAAASAPTAAARRRRALAHRRRHGGCPERCGGPLTALQVVAEKGRLTAAPSCQMSAMLKHRCTQPARVDLSLKRLVTCASLMGSLA